MFALMIQKNFGLGKLQGQSIGRGRFYTQSAPDGVPPVIGSQRVIIKPQQISFFPQGPEKRGRTVVLDSAPIGILEISRRFKGMASVSAERAGRVTINRAIDAENGPIGQLYKALFLGHPAAAGRGAKSDFTIGQGLPYCMIRVIIQSTAFQQNAF